MTIPVAGELGFGVLGPLTVLSRGRSLPIGGAKRRLVLATLLLSPNKRVSADRLIEAVWASEPPRSAIANLQTYISGLRTCLADAPGDPRIQRRTDGYSIVVTPGELDLQVFEELTVRADQLRLEGHLAEALGSLRRALDLWRGEPLEDLPANPVWEAELVRLTEARLVAMEERLALLVAVGQYATAATELRALLAEYPFRERSWRQLMLALHLDGRRVEALQAYIAARRLFIDEMGVEPGRDLQRTHEAILAGEFLPGGRTGAAAGDHTASTPASASLGPPARTPANPPAARTGPLAATAASGQVCQLPPDIPDFTGRRAETAALVEVLSAPRTGGAPATVTVVGTPGAGKSTLALHTAHLVADAFPDGQLYADLAGTTARPREPVDVLGELLRALGVDGSALPKGEAERAALYRSRLAGRRVLVLLDDAAGAAQVRPLLPGAWSCGVLVTSRHLLAELPGAYTCALDALPAAEGAELIARIVGPDRIEREPEEAAAILDACGYLPLAIRIAGAKLAARRAWPLRVLGERLVDESRRLTELQVGDLGVRASFETSMRLLPTDAGRGFRLLGLLGAQTWPAWVVAALLDRPHADDVLDVLLDAHLVQLAEVDPTGRPRYRLHDLLRCYAREAGQADPVDEWRAALTRVLGGWLTLAERADDQLAPSLLRTARGNAPRWPFDPEVAARLVGDPLVWFDAERRSLNAATALAADAGLDELAWELAAIAGPYLDHRCHYEAWHRGHQDALAAVRAAGNARGEAVLLRGLGQIAVYWDDYPEADRALARSRRLSGELGDRRAEASATAALGTVRRMLGRYEDALRHYREALATFVAVGDRCGEAQLRNSIGVIFKAQGQTDQAVTWLEGALQLARDTGDPHRTAGVLYNLGDLRLAEGRTTAALECLRQARRIFDSLGDRHCMARALYGLSRAYAAEHDQPGARADLGAAAAIFAQAGDRRGVALCARLFGELDLARGEYAAARQHLDEAQQIWRELRMTNEAEATADVLRRVEEQASRD